MSVIKEGRMNLVDSKGKIVSYVTFLSEPEDVKKDIIAHMNKHAWELSGYEEIQELDELIEELELKYVPYVEPSWIISEERMLKLIDVIMKMTGKGLTRLEIFDNIKNNLKK